MAIMAINVRNWCGCDIRLVKHDGTWYAVLKDIGDALNRHHAHDPRSIPVPSLTRATIAQPMPMVNERGPYQVLPSNDRRPETRHVTAWVCTMLEHMSTAIGLRPEIQLAIDEQLDDVLVYYKE